MDESDQEDQGEDHVDRQHEKDPAIAKVQSLRVQEELRRDEDRKWYRNGLGGGLQAGEDPGLVGIDEGRKEGPRDGGLRAVADSGQDHHDHGLGELADDRPAEGRGDESRPAEREYALLAVAIGDLAPGDRGHGRDEKRQRGERQRQLVGQMDVRGEKQREVGKDRAEAEEEHEERAEEPKCLPVAERDLEVRAERDVLGARGDVAPLVDPTDGDRERRDHRDGDAPVRPRRRGLALGGDHDQAQEAHLSDELDALRQAGEKTALMDRRDIGEQSGVGVDRGVEEDREQEDRDGERHQRFGRGRGDEKEHRGERDADGDERSPSAEAGPDAGGRRSDGGLADDSLDAARAREKAGEEMGCAGGLEGQRQQEVVEREERARSDRASGVDEHRAKSDRHARAEPKRDYNWYQPAAPAIERMFYRGPKTCDNPGEEGANG